MERYNRKTFEILKTLFIWLLTSILVIWLFTRSKPQLTVLDDETTLKRVIISSELTKLPDKLCFIWMSTRDIFLRKSSYPCKHRYGLEFSIKHKSLHLVLCILLAGDIATNPGPTLPNAQFRNLSTLHLQVPVD